jgi:hypothetical protein
VTAPGDPFDALSYGEHRTDSGLRYVASPPPAAPGAFDPLVGRDVDVMGRAFMRKPAGRSADVCFLVELNLQSLDLGVGASADLDTAVDLMPQVLAHRGMSVCRDVWQDQPDPQVATRWSVQLHDRPRRPSGIYAPDHTGRPGGWQVIAPLPPTGPVMTAMLPTVGWQALVWITTRTAHLYAVPDGETLMADLAVQADAGHVWFARAVVLP